MSITSFSKPSDSDVLRVVSEDDKNVSFVGKGSIHQQVDETLYVRTVKISSKKRVILKNVIYVKRGIKWFFKRIENASA